MEATRKKKIAIVGGGSAGLACAWSLARYPHLFDVHVFEKEDVAGGVSTSETVGNGQWINDGVQGATPSYRNTLLFHQHFGFEHHPVKFKVSFGKGPTAWNNTCDTSLIEHHRHEIKKFGKILKLVNKLELIFAFIPIRTVLKIFRFSKEFRDQMVFPLTALFFGTGNQTPSVSSVVVARVFLDPDMKLFDYDPDSLLHQHPDMMAFGNLNQLYETIAGTVDATIHRGRAVEHVERHHHHIIVTDNSGKQEEFDEIVMACSAETAKKILDRPGFWERFVLGSVTYFNDVTITHEDEEYIRRHYEVDDERRDQYFVRNDPDDSEIIEMSFNLTNYQPQLDQDASDAERRNIWQTIFLNDKISDKWTRPEINEDKVLLVKWWRQMSHTWKHFLKVVPWVRFIQNNKHTWYCGSWTLFNTHEMAIISGLAVAERLGAPYPFDHDQLARKQFENLFKISHGKKRTVGTTHDDIQDAPTSGKKAEIY